MSEYLIRQVGWLGPYGLIPGGMDNDPAPNWRPVFVLATDDAEKLVEQVSDIAVRKVMEHLKRMDAAVRRRP